MLAAALRRVLADTFVMYVHAHGAHWNVTGPNFPEYHSFLGDLYNELWGAIDDIAEHIRTIGTAAPGTVGTIVLPTIIPDVDPGSNWDDIRAQLEKENFVLIAGLNEAFGAAMAANNQGIVNFLADRLDRHAKHAWMLASSK